MVSFEKKLDAELSKIRKSLPKNFTSSNFIKVIKDYCPNEYAAALHNSGSHRTLHSWIARWYLSRRFDPIKDVAIETSNGNKGHNKLWDNK